ncbi:hypothetical protein N6L26_05780 [Qipengyuania sp. SS22]|uniref:hypothetical protein n=1 Tax=Qipengyuania sp. SS22 TaxID=2979461 RepID=UPI0021E5CA4F|nr:hypothetical protein [Qipengyuania sp. SS22]UYH56062.1 hypothetical protein N6L26_05780 [Qipengyuania sp. SS22]
MMRKTFYFVAGGALASLSIPTIAQDVSADATSDEAVTAETNMGLSAEQQASYDSWPVELQGQFDAWPGEVQSYYWSLTPERRELFWRISDANKLTVSGLPAEQQAQAWMQIEAQAATQVAPSADEPMAEPDQMTDMDSDAADPM